MDLARGKRERGIGLWSRPPGSDLPRDGPSKGHFQGGSQQELPVGEHDDIDPMSTLSAEQQSGTGGVEAQMLFNKPEEVFDHETPQIHATQIRQGDGERTGPK